MNNLEKLYIGGGWVEPSGSGTLTVTHSATEEVLGTIPEGEPAAKIVRQPESTDEEEACEEAADYCPTGGLVKNSSADS